MNKKTLILKAALAITISLTLILPCTSVLAISEQPEGAEGGSSSTWNWIMGVSDVMAHPGERNVILPISGLWSDELAGYCIGLYYDSSKIEIVGITLADTVADHPNTMWASGLWSWDDEIITAGTWTFGTDFIPPGHGTLFNLIVNVKEDVDSYTWTDIIFYEDEAQPPIKCMYYLADYTSAHPEILDDGWIFFIPPAIRSYQDADI